MELTPAARKKLAQFEASRLTDLPICMAKTQGRSAIQGVSQYVSKKMRSVKVTLKAGYSVLLLPPLQYGYKRRTSVHHVP